MKFLIAFFDAMVQFAYSCITGLSMHPAPDGNGDGDDVGYEAEDEWDGGQRVGEWRRSRNRKKGTPSWSWMKEPMSSEETPGDDEYEADDEWPPRPKIGQIRKFMKRKMWRRPKGPRECSDTDYIQRNIIDPEDYDYERGEHQPGDLKLDSDYSYGYGD